MYNSLYKENLNDSIYKLLYKESLSDSIYNSLYNENLKDSIYKLLYKENLKDSIYLGRNILLNPLGIIELRTEYQLFLRKFFKF